MKASGRLVRVADISLQRRDEMHALMDCYYQNMDRSSFDADLDEKQWVIQVVDEVTSELIGFSTQVLMEVQVAGRLMRALFSGDTIVARNGRGQRQLFQVSGWLLRNLMETYTDEELYWFLISKGYKTYRFLPVFFREFYPCHARPTRARFAAVIDALGSYQSPANYDRRSGVIRAGPRAYRLRPGVADLTTGRLHDPHVRFFAQRNPGHAAGDELCCIAPLTLANFTRAAYRAMGPEPPVELALS